MGPAGKVQNVGKIAQLATDLRVTPAPRLEALRERGEQARLHAEEQFDAVRTTDRVMELYDSVIGNRR